MVDPISNSGGVTPIKSAVSKQQAGGDKEVESAVRAEKEVSSSAPVDRVEISAEAQEALSASQAEAAARDVRTALQKDLDKVLGIDPSFAEQVGDGDDAVV